MTMMLAQMIFATLHMVVNTHKFLAMIMINVPMNTVAQLEDVNTILLLVTITTPVQKIAVNQALDVNT
jgi:hypothetical protein